MKNLLFFVLFTVLLNFDAKALVLATLPSTLSDTCVEINLKSGIGILAKITKKTTEKVYFKKCDDLSDKTEYFVLQEKIDTIKSLNVKEDTAQEYDSAVPYDSKPALKLKEEEKMKRTRIWALLSVNVSSLLILLGLSGLAAGITGLSVVAFLLLGISGIWGFIEALNYKGKFEGKGFAIGYFVTMNVLFLLFLLFVILLILLSF